MNWTGCVLNSGVRMKEINESNERSGDAKRATRPFSGLKVTMNERKSLKEEEY